MRGFGCPVWLLSYRLGSRADRKVEKLPRVKVRPPRAWRGSSGLPSWSGFLEPGYHVLVKTQRDGDLSVLSLGSSAKVSTHSVGWGQEGFSENTGLC